MTAQTTWDISIRHLVGQLDLLGYYLGGKNLRAEVPPEGLLPQVLKRACRAKQLSKRCVGKDLKRRLFPNRPFF